MKARPILFRPEMVRALLEGRKTQTRRVVKPQPAGAWAAPGKTACPYGQPGDLLWVRETFTELSPTDPATGEQFECGPGERIIDDRLVAYRANSDVVFCDGDGFSSPDFADKSDMPRWRPSIHMPRWASRLTLRITEVRVERVQDISEADAIAEGILEVEDEAGALFYSGRYDQLDADQCVPNEAMRYYASDAFRDLWDTMRAGTEHAWDRNPWVWVIAFEVIRANVDQVLTEAAA